MDKIKLNTLGAPAEPDPIPLTLPNNTTILVKPRLPYEEVLDMMQWCIDYIITDKPFLSAPLNAIIRDFALLKYYTNLDFSWMDNIHELHDVYAEYDLITSSNLISQVEPLIDQSQLAFFNNTLQATLDSIMDYRNSAKGIIDALTDAAKDSSSNMEKALEMVDDDEEMERIKTLLEFAKNLK